MIMEVTLLGGKRVAARYRDFEIVTDQPAKHGGRGRAPSPFDLFLASLGTCAAFMGDAALLLAVPRWRQ
jgi:ribosomal protein S12 methylthiotransferase accessory factor